MKIKDIGITITGKTPSTKNKEFFNGNIPFITPTDIAKGYIVTKTERHISASGYNSIKPNVLEGLSVLVGCIGSDMGNVAMVKGRCASNQQINAITQIKENINPYYVYYWLSLKKKYFRQLAGITTTPILPKSVLDEIEIDLPAVEIQNRIAAFLSVIDEKIENNKKINSELESMVKTIYDYWFLQFDFPDENGSPYKSCGGKMVWNEELKREIPEGWRVGVLKDIATITMGSSPKSESLNEKKDGMVFYQGKTDFGDRFPKVRMYTNAPIRYAEENDILLSVRAPVGYLNIANEKCCIGRGLAAISSQYKSFVFYLMNSNHFQFDKYNNGGTTFGAITKDELFNMKIIIPKKNIINAFSEKVATYDKMIFNKSKENNELVLLRNYLLPLLLNGQVGFNDFD